MRSLYERGEGVNSALSTSFPGLLLLILGVSPMLNPLLL